MEELKHIHPPPSYTQGCYLAHPTQPHTLSPQPTKNTKSINCFTCGKQESISSRGFHYHCTICDVDFHASCRAYPRKILHPFHLQHPLLLTYGKHENIIDGSNIEDQGSNEALTVNSNSSTSDPGKSRWGSIFDNCTWCGNYIPTPSSHPRMTRFYRCSICNFCLDTMCAQRIPPPTIENPKGHHHSLVLFPRPLKTPCDACGLVIAWETGYACFQCNYMVHQYCVDLPRVIKITRHPHRLSYSPYLSPPNPLCRVCYKTVDIKYGHYSCKKEDCSYVLHSKCATHVMVWDGKELEWEPEETGVIEDILPFKNVGDGLIDHFSHGHHLKLEKYDSVRDARKQCEACVLPIHLHDFYNCMQCDFFLHLVCAGLPRKMDHALHNHSIILDPFPLPDDSKLQCSACSRTSTGFKYRCSEKDCQINYFKIDIPCLLIPEYSTNKVHQHPLFIAPYNYDHEPFRCNGCKRGLTKNRLQCTLCDFFICYECATIPNELHYIHDEHPLTLCYGEDTDGKYWCEECEKEVNPSEWFYTCNKCCITIHRNCLFGFYVYLKPGYSFKYHNRDMVEVLDNRSSTRPICSRCEDRCQGSIYIKVDVRTLCSSCLLKS